jgi:hypothetical protein
MVDDITNEEQQMYEEAMYGGYPQAEEKHNIFTFFKKVILMDDTTRVANVNNEELGLVKIPVRTLLNLSLYCKEVGLSGLGHYFLKESHILTDSSLGREGFVPRLAVTQKREMETRRKDFSEAQKKTWFKKNPKPGVSDY